MDYQLFDIVMLQPKFGARIYAIVAVEPEHPKNAYVAVRLDKGPLAKRYRLADDHIQARIGTLDPAALTLPATASAPEPENWEMGQHYARYMALQAPTDEDRRRWVLLSRLRPGDPVYLVRYTSHGERVELHRFREVLTTGQRYHFTAVNSNGTIYRWTLDSLDLGDKNDQLPPGSSRP